MDFDEFGFETDTFGKRPNLVAHVGAPRGEDPSGSGSPPPPSLLGGGDEPDREGVNGG